MSSFSIAISKIQDETKLLIWFSKLDYGTWRYHNPISVLENNNITLTLQKGGRLYEWLTAKETSFNNASIIFTNVDNSIIYTEGNACGIIAIPIIECIFENYHIHVSHDLSKQ